MSFSRQYTAQYPQHWPPLAGRVLLKPIFNSALNCCPSLPPSSLHTGLTFYTLAEKCQEWVLEFINIVSDMESICLNVWSKDPCQSGYKSNISTLFLAICNLLEIGLNLFFFNLWSKDFIYHFTYLSISRLYL